jgi:hypothetical protein
MTTMEKKFKTSSKVDFTEGEYDCGSEFPDMFK